MKKFISVLLAVLTLVSSLTLFAFASESVQYVNKGFYLYAPHDFIEDTQWAEKYGYLNYWHTEDYGIEMILNIGVGNEGEFRQKYPDEEFYYCHNFNEKTYCITRGQGSEEVSFNGNDGTVGTVTVEFVEEDCPIFTQKEYRFEKWGETYQVTFYIHDEVLYGFYPQMIMESFDLVPYWFILRWGKVITPLVSFFVFALIWAYSEKKKRKKYT